jgi:GT2 family glycosyltransferase
MSGSSATIAAVVLNYRTAGLTLQCLESLAGERGRVPGLSAIVVDNASGDGSDQTIAAGIAARGWNDWARLIRAPANRGFAAGNNLGAAAAADADLLLLLNSDTIVRPGAVAALAEALAARPDVGLVSPRLEWPDGTPQESCFRFLRPPTELVRAAATGPISRLLARHVPAMPVSETPLEPDWTSFACVLVRRALYEALGGLDEGYFMYYEDVDFCRRARAAGARVLHWPAARVVHLRGQSGDVKQATAERRRRPGYYYAARARYYAKFHGGRAGLWVANACWYAGRAVALAREAVRHKRPHTCAGEARDIWIGGRDPLAPWTPAGAATP